MNDDAEDRTGWLRKLASEARRREGSRAHPSPESLTAYQAGELSTTASEELQDHLALCRHCTQLLLDLEDFLAAPDGEVSDAGQQVAPAWRVLRGRLPELHESLQRAGVRRESAPARGRWFASRRTLVRVAVAALLVGAVVPPLWIIAIKVTAPKRLQIVKLYPTEVPRGTSPAWPPAPAEVKPDEGGTVLLLHLAKEQPNRRRFLVQVRSAAVSAAARWQTLPVADVVGPRTLLLILAPRRLAPGRYQLQVLDAANPSADSLGDFLLHVGDP